MKYVWLCGHTVRIRRSPGRYIISCRNTGIVMQIRPILVVRTMFQNNGKHRTTVLSWWRRYEQVTTQISSPSTTTSIEVERGLPHCTPEGNVSLTEEAKEKTFIAHTRMFAWEEGGTRVCILQRRYIITEWRRMNKIPNREKFPCYVFRGGFSGWSRLTGRKIRRKGRSKLSFTFLSINEELCILPSCVALAKWRNFVWLRRLNCPKNVRARHERNQ